GTAAVQLGVAFAVHRSAAADRSVLSLLVGLVIAFITIAVPVQLDGEWVTTAWAAEAVVLFAIGRARSIAVYEWLSYPLFIFALLRLLGTWEGILSDPTPVPVFNSGFVTNLFVSACLIVSLWVDHIFRDETVLEENAARVARLILGGGAIFVTYMTFGFEIANYWESGGDDLILYERFKAASILVYSIAFTVGLAYLNRNAIRDSVLSALCVALSLTLLMGYLIAGLATVNAIAESFWFPDDYGAQAGAAGLLIRYVTFAAAASLFLILRRTNEAESAVPGIPNAVRFKALDIILHVTILATLSAELLMWLDFAAPDESTRLGLSLLWGLYAVMLVIVGIRSHKRHLRIAAICLFSFTLGKVFLYDLAGLGTVARTVLFVSLGILLLVASYLYNRYSSVINEPDEA
ncbi:MAG: DUF2339 domain-containing protein, partial [Aridibacter famidurans]|nr:DUF2339 domain-containing protein [Aridibacter famidurans]